MAVSVEKKLSNLFQGDCPIEAITAGWFDVQTACQIFEQRAGSLPNQTALIYQDTKISYQTLNEITNQMARYIKDSYVVKTGKTLKLGTLIPISLKRSPDFVIGILAILKAGGAYVPINPEYPSNRISHILNEIDATLIITESVLFDKFSMFSDDISCISIEKENYQRFDNDNLNLPQTANDLAYVIYTSGSSGKPKGVMATHATLISQTVCASYFYADEKDTVAFFSDVSFDSTTTEIWGALLSGARLFIPDNFFELLSNATLFKEAVKTHQLSVVLLTRALFDLLFSLDESAFSDIRFMMVGGEALTKHIMQKLQKSVHKPAYLINAYGPTENSTFCTTYEIQSDFSQYTSVPIGKPYSNRIGFVLDKYNQLMPIGVTGELFVGGTSISKGYLKHPEKTADKFIKNPYFNESGKHYANIYKTNDLVRWLPEGQLEYIGRNDFMVKLRGYRIELGEIETRMAEIKNVSHSIVIMEKDNNNSYLIGYYVANKPIEDKGFRDALLEKLPDYMVPSYFVYLKTLPVTTNGKLDRKALPKPKLVKQQKAKPEPKLSLNIEKTLKGIWQNEIGIKNPDRNASFFDLGGNSLAAMQVRNVIEQTFKIKINIVDLFQHPSLLSLSNFLQSKLGKVSSTLSSSSQTKNQSEERLIKNSDIAIIGMSCRLPGVDDINEFWQLLENGQSLIKDLDIDNHNENFVNRGSFFENPYLFDADFFKYSVKEAELTDPQHRLFLECAWQALEDSGHIPNKSDKEVGVFASQGRNSYFVDEVNPNVSDATSVFQSVLGNDKDFLSARVSYKLNLKGPSMTLQSACSSSLVSVQQACESLLVNSCDVALAGGVSIFYNKGYTYVEDMIESPDGYCRAFDDKAKGTVITSGCGVVVLKRLNDAITDRDNIYAIIKGGAVTNDGNAKMAFTAPSVDGQVRVIEKALKKANVSAKTIEYVEAHGTGTKLGDPIEWRALHNVYEKYNDNKNSCTIGALKTNIGHTDSAAGVLGLIKATLSLKNQLKPATLNFQKLNREIADFNTIFDVSNTSKQWSSSYNKRRAAVSSFGLGGSNAHVILEEYHQNEVVNENTEDLAHFFIPISAKSDFSLTSLIGKYQSFIDKTKIKDLPSIVYSSLVSRESFDNKALLYGFSHQNQCFSLLVFKRDVLWPIKLQLIFGQTFYAHLNDFYKNQEMNVIAYPIFLALMLGFMWQAGFEIDIAAVANLSGKENKKPLPAYPFLHNHYQIKAELEKQDDEAINADNAYILKGLWAKVLGVSINDIDSESDFYDLGGESLTYIDLHNLMKKQFSIDIALSELVDLITFEEMLSLVEKEVGDNE